MKIIPTGSYLPGHVTASYSFPKMRPLGSALHLGDDKIVSQRVGTTLNIYMCVCMCLYVSVYYTYTCVFEVLCRIKNE